MLSVSSFNDVAKVQENFWNSDAAYYYLVVAIIFFVLLVFGYYFWERYSRIRFPRYFLIEREYLSDVIPSLRKIVTKPTEKIKVDFSEVEDMTDGSYMVFLAQVEKALTKDKEVRLYLKKKPKSQKVLEMLATQKNYKHKNIRITSDIIPNKTNTLAILDPDYIDEVVKELKKLGFTEYYQPFYDFLVEIIGNATEHGIRHRSINWWMWKNRDYSHKCMRYVFVDMGVGIIKSYKESGLLRRYRMRDKRKIPIDALNGKLGSSTKQPNRGRGLPQIKDIIEKGYISDFVLITNGVSLHYENGEFIASKNPNFVGTYYSWTINKENYIKWKSSQ